MAAVAETLAGRVEDLIDDVQEVIVGVIPDLRADATEVLHDSIRANIETALHALAALQDSNEATAPARTLAYAQALSLVSRGRVRKEGPWPTWRT